MTLCAIVGLVAAAVFWMQAGVHEAKAEGLQDELDHQQEEAKGLRNEVERLKQSLAEEEKNRGIDRPSCLGGTTGSVPSLFRVTVNRDSYQLERLWQPEPPRTAPAEASPDFLALTEVPARELSRAEFFDQARRIYDFGERRDTFDGPCRFYVELKRGSSISAPDYREAKDLVATYLFIGNSSEVLRELAEGQ